MKTIKSIKINIKLHFLLILYLRIRITVTSLQSRIKKEKINNKNLLSLSKLSLSKSLGREGGEGEERGWWIKAVEVSLGVFDGKCKLVQWSGGRKVVELKLRFCPLVREGCESEREPVTMRN